MAARRTNVLILGLLFIVVIASCFFLYFGRTSTERQASAATKTSAAANPAVSAAGNKQASSASPSATKQDIVAELVAGGKQGWLQALRQYFPGVSLAEAWDILSAPGVADQFAAKAIRNQIIDVCLNPPSGGNSGLVQERCASLRKAHSQEYLRQEYDKIQADQDYWLSDARLRGELPEKLSPKDLASDRAVAERQAFQSDDPWLAESGVTKLIALKSPLLLSDWSQTGGLTQDQLGYVLDTIPVDRACQLIGSCDANSFFTLRYCRAGMVCPAGASFEEIVQLNLNQVQLALRQQILSNLANAQRNP